MINLKGTKKIALFTHIRPDGDALGSMNGLALALRKKGIEVDCYCDSEIPSLLSFLPNAGSIQNGALNNYYDMMISVDCADEFRLGKYKDIYLKHANTVNIDHHMTNTSYAKHNIIKNLSSSCELVFEVIKSLNIKMDDEIALNLYVGTVTDTGHFTQANTTSGAHLAAAELIKYNIDIEDLSQKLFKEISKEKLMLIKDCITYMRFFSLDRISFIGINQDMLQKYNLDINETEGIINYAINIQGVMIGICLTESAKNTYKVSLRSKKGVNIADIAAMFGGGGHLQAAGFMINGCYEDVVERIIKECEKALELV
ncbi:MAG TPA: bifunctional oligoribonuclease/PAP phosphatase NrnA [Clostridiales bacterium]|jgi:phosphoesterase RecJ-like protein|nr:bifunctional oligoribonuclease/PAP phosphatase NrnA [Clostridiales bacterium]